MALQAIQQKDFEKRLMQTGLTKAMRASQALESVRLYIQSELPNVHPQEVEPLFVKGNTIVVRTASAAVSQLLKDYESDIVQYVRSTTKLEIEQLRFRT